MSTASTSEYSGPRSRPWWAGPNIMDRYIAKELTLPFLFGVGAFSSIGISIGALFELIRRITESGLAITLAIQIFVLKLPEFIVLAFPMSTLLATMMTYSRFSSDSELIALRGCGVSIRRIIAPAVVLSLLVTGLTFVFNELITPAANYRAAITLERALDSERPPFQERNIFYQEFQPARDDAGAQELKRQFYARRFDGETMYGLTILDFSQEGLNQVVSAESATWDFSSNTWSFYNGTIYVVSPDGSYRNIVTFETQQLKLPRTPFDLASRTKSDAEMNIAEATRQLELVRQSGDEKNDPPLGNTHSAKICPALRMCGVWPGGGFHWRITPAHQSGYQLRHQHRHYFWLLSAGIYHERHGGSGYFVTLHGGLATDATGVGRRAVFIV
jgi:lipopolysaccharide export system permease protein